MKNLFMLTVVTFIMSCGSESDFLRPSKLPELPDQLPESENKKEEDEETKENERTTRQQRPLERAPRVFFFSFIPILTRSLGEGLD